jgi:hypothetical protein
VKKGLYDMSRKVLFVLCLGFLFLAWGVYSAAGQDGEEAHPIVTTATDSVGVGTYVAAQAFAFPANEEDPAAFPLRAQIIPYGIYPICW